MVWRNFEPIATTILLLSRRDNHDGTKVTKEKGTCHFPTYVVPVVPLWSKLDLAFYLRSRVKTGAAIDAVPGIISDRRYG